MPASGVAVKTAEIRRRRLALGLTQLQLAENAGVSYPHLNNVEEGRKPPSVTVVAKLAAALGCEPADLLRRSA